MAEELGEKTEAPTSRRLAEAREHGQVAKSQDLVAAIDLIAGTILIVLIGAFVASSMAEIMRRSLDEADAGLDIGALYQLLTDGAIRGATAVAPVLGVAFVVGALAHLAQVGLVFSSRALQPKLDRLDPIAGFGRVFGKRNLGKAIINTLKLLLVAGASWLVLRGLVGEVVGLPRLGLGGALGVLGDAILSLVIVLLTVLLVLGLIDYFYQRWQHMQDLKMTKDAVKDERRSMEGDPKVKAARFRMAREIALQRINQAVPNAEVVVTNPTHFAVALRYDEDTMRAPRVVAKGADYLAMRIRQVAGLHRVPIVERPPLARALYAGCEVGQEVPPELYQAVAEVLAFVYRLEQEAA
ncbi:MAG: flagellar biosynthesis protein FlhB [Planctomycetota bacterium]|nr:flagellar biosynthesis protein FlhB [Planctomycetota bacterium]